MNRLTMAVFVSASLFLSSIGCGGKPPGGATGNGHAGEPAAHGEEHAAHGPHQGQLIELGAEEYHAELVHDEKAGTVTVYFLDASAKQNVPIDVPEITINLKHNGKGEQFKLAAQPDTGDPPGKSSRFVSREAELAKDLDTEGVEAHLSTSINGKPFSSAIEHHHD